jgi:hypothetical protein
MERRQVTTLRFARVRVEQGIVNASPHPTALIGARPSVQELKAEPAHAGAPAQGLYEVYRDALKF